MNIKAPLTANPVQEIEWQAVIIRCGCGDPDSHNGKRGPASPCPTPRGMEDLGVVAFWSRNPFKRLAWWLKQKWRGR